MPLECKGRILMYGLRFCARWMVMVVLIAGFSGCFGDKTPAPQVSAGALSNNEIIILSFIGDNILGDYFGSSGETFNWKFTQIQGDYRYFFAKVQDVLANDDMTLANLEGPLTTHNGDRMIKPFAFKGDPKYINILKEGSIEAVNVANNHTRDYGMKGFQDTISTLKQSPIHFSGEGYLSIYKVKGKNIGMAGHRGWNPAIKSQVKNEIKKLREMGADMVIFTFHWGEEREHYPNKIQKEIGRFAIDNGADLVIGHHPHVLQGIEEYKGKKIVYSLANFVYGGAKNPKDKDTIIYQVRLAFGKHQSDLESLIKSTDFISNKKVKPFVKMEEWSELHSFVPVSISGEKTFNNYQPVILQGEDKQRVIKRMNTYSQNLSE